MLFSKHRLDFPTLDKLSVKVQVTSRYLLANIECKSCSSVIYVCNTPICYLNMSFVSNCFIYCPLFNKAIIKCKVIKVFVIVMGHVFSTNDYSHLDINNCAYQKTLLFNDSMSIFIIGSSKGIPNLCICLRATHHFY